MYTSEEQCSEKLYCHPNSEWCLKFYFVYQRPICSTILKLQTFLSSVLLQYWVRSLGRFLCRVYSHRPHQSWVRRRHLPDREDNASAKVTGHPRHGELFCFNFDKAILPLQFSCAIITSTCQNTNLKKSSFFVKKFKRTWCLLVKSCGSLWCSVGSFFR